MIINKKQFKRIDEYLWEIPSFFSPEMRVPARIYASEKTLESILQDKSVSQLINGASLPGIIRYAIAMPDCHEGYSVPIGFVGAIKTSDGVISPGACGFDINCGVRLLKSELEEKEVKNFLEQLANEIYNLVPSGLGKGREKKLSFSEIDKILEGGVKHLFSKGYASQEDIENCEAGGRLEWADPSEVSKKAKERGRDQVGTLGSGNHFLEIQKVSEIFDKKIAQAFGLFENQIVVMIHTGSRGLGHQVCGDYLKTMTPLMERYGIRISNKEFASVPFYSEYGQKYFKAMASAANYAWANRQMITYYVRKAWQKIFNKNLSLLYDVAHNIIKKEKHNVEGKEIDVIVHRKGATRAFPPGNLEIPLRYRNTGQPVILPGSMGTASYVMVGLETGSDSFYTTAHGSGRVMSRHAALKSINGKKVIEKLSEKGILVKTRSLRNIAEEAPEVYKDIEEVANIIDKAGLSKKVARLKPLAVIKGE